MIGKIEANDVNFWYGDFHALKGISMSIEERSVVAFIGPSGCGKSTFLRLFNRMNDLIPNTRLTGEIHIDGKDIYGNGFGMVIVLVALTPLAHSLAVLYVGSALLTSALELAAGWILKKVFHTSWWDYGDVPFNLGGYICLKFAWPGAWPWWPL